MEQSVLRFKSHFGSHPDVYAQIWEDLQSTADPEAPVNALDNDLDAFLIGLHFLKCYPRESKQAGMFNISERTVRKYNWHYATKIQALKS
jgi:hypothetical protein